MAELPQIDISKGFGDMMKQTPLLGIQDIQAPVMEQPQWQVQQPAIQQPANPLLWLQDIQTPMSSPIPAQQPVQQPQQSIQSPQQTQQPMEQAPISDPIRQERMYDNIAIDMEKRYGIDPANIDKIAQKASAEMWLPQDADPAKRALFYIEKNQGNEAALEEYKMWTAKRIWLDLMSRASNYWSTVAKLTNKLAERQDEISKMNDDTFGQQLKQNAKSILANFWYLGNVAGSLVGEAGMWVMEFVDNLTNKWLTSRDIYVAMESEWAKEIMESIATSAPVEQTLSWVAKHPEAAKDIWSAMWGLFGALDVATLWGAWAARWAIWKTVTKGIWKTIETAGDLWNKALDVGKAWMGKVMPGVPKIITAPKKALKGLQQEMLRYPMDEQVKTAIGNVWEGQAAKYLSMAKARQKDVNKKSALLWVTDEMNIKYKNFIEEPMKAVWKQIGALKDTIKKWDNVDFDPTWSISKLDNILSDKYNAKFVDWDLIPVKWASVSADLSPVDISAVLEIRNKVLKSDNLFDAIERINDMNKIYQNKMTTAGQIKKNKNLISSLEEIKQDIVGKIDDQLWLWWQYKELNAEYSKLANMKNRFKPLFMKEKTWTETISAIKKLFSPAAWDVDRDIKEFGELVGRDWGSEARIAKHFATKYWDNTVKSLLDTTSEIGWIAKSAFLWRPIELVGRILSSIGEKILGDPDKALLAMAKKLDWSWFEFDPSKIIKLRGAIKKAKNAIDKWSDAKKAKTKLQTTLSQAITPLQDTPGKFNKTQGFPWMFNQPGITRTTNDPMQLRGTFTPKPEPKKWLDSLKQRAKDIWPKAEDFNKFFDSLTDEDLIEIKGNANKWLLERSKVRRFIEEQQPSVPTKPKKIPKTRKEKMEEIKAKEKERLKKEKANAIKVSEFRDYDIDINRLFHGTSTKNAADIKAWWFKLGSEIDELRRGGGSWLPQNSISFSVDKKEAARFADGGEVLEIKPNRELKLATTDVTYYAEDLNPIIKKLQAKGYDWVYLPGEKEVVIFNKDSISII